MESWAFRFLPYGRNLKNLSKLCNHASASVQFVVLVKRGGLSHINSIISFPMSLGALTTVGGSMTSGGSI